MMDVSTTGLLSQSLRRALEAEGAAGIEAALEEVGWRDALAAEGTAVAAVLFAEQGAANVTSAALDDLMVAAVGLPPGAGIGFVQPGFGNTAAPGRVSGGLVSVRGLATGRMLAADRAVVVAEHDGVHRARVVRTGDLTVRPVAGVDPRLGLVSVEAVCPEWTDVAVVDWSCTVGVGQIALAYELIGAGRTMLRLAREHALTRVQFGRPIGSFQAVRHRLADSLVALESAQALAAAALESAGPALPAPVSPLLAGMAKALAGRGVRTVARHCQQVLAGVGFTAEHHFHRYFRRALVLDGLLGDARTLTRDLGAELLRTRRIPTAPAL
jgi:hypothetical protein